jgi:AcrR family transcriptional regulator
MVVPPSPRAADPRPARTRAAIQAAVERLTATAGAEVTVNAIAQEAGVSRTSFYAQFEDLDALAVSMLVDAFRDIGHDDVVARRAAGADAHRAARSSAFRLVEHIAARRAFYRASLDWKLTARVREVVEAAFAEQVLVSLDVAPGRLPAGLDRRDAARFVAGGVLAVLTAWLRDDDAPTDPEAVADRLVSLLPGWLTRPS